MRMKKNIMKKIYLKQKKEKVVLRRHPWIFSGAIQQTDQDITDGDIVSVCSSNGIHLGHGYYNSKTQIAVRLLTFRSQEVTDDYLRSLISNGVQKRTCNPLLKNTDSCRLIFSEGDFFPGLIIDSYGGHLVVQSLTLGIDRMKDTLIRILVDLLQPESIYERSEHEGRLLEGIQPVRGQIFGTSPAELIMLENGMSFFVDVREGQKTGFYLDQRDSRDLVKRLARDRNVLNLFCYTGGFSVAAALGGARSVISVDASEVALLTARKNIALNHASTETDFIKADVFEFLRNAAIDCNLVILDPPALATSRTSVQNACRGYKELHLQIASKCPKNSLVLTSSCSRFIGMDLFQMIIFEAFADAGRNASILGKYYQPCDHPTNIFCPETEYLKTLLLQIE
jgi:23S rRNA (cytosine1962-C5)-methyltransferase